MKQFWSMFYILKKPMWEDIVGIKNFRMNNKISSLDCNTNKILLFVVLFKCTQFLNFNWSINLSLFRSPRNECSTYIKDFNSSWRTKSSHSRADFSTFRFISSKRISSLVFVGSGGASCCFDEGVHTFTASFIISNRLIFLHLYIPISSSLLLLAFLQCGWSASEF